MTKLRWIAVSGCFLMLSLTSGLGCAQMPELSATKFLHELKPHRLWRWNRGPAPSSDAYFSVPDDITQELDVSRSSAGG